MYVKVIVCYISVICLRHSVVPSISIIVQYLTESQSKLFNSMIMYI